MAGSAEGDFGCDISLCVVRQGRTREGLVISYVIPLNLRMCFS